MLKFSTKKIEIAQNYFHLLLKLPKIAFFSPTAAFRFWAIFFRHEEDFLTAQNLGGGESYPPCYNACVNFVLVRRE